jgi:hypothetical protein
MCRGRVGACIGVLGCGIANHTSFSVCSVQLCVCSDRGVRRRQLGGAELTKTSKIMTCSCICKDYCIVTSEGFLCTRGCMPTCWYPQIWRFTPRQQQQKQQQHQHSQQQEHQQQQQNKQHQFANDNNNNTTTSTTTTSTTTKPQTTTTTQPTTTTTTQTTTQTTGISLTFC